MKAEKDGCLRRQNRQERPQEREAGATSNAAMKRRRDPSTYEALDWDLNMIGAVDLEDSDKEFTVFEDTSRDYSWWK